jgi:HlyD family secretion protein/epimerase transport system membrane fusion protein
MVKRFIPRGPIAIGLLIILFGFGSFFLWATLSEIDAAAIAPGTVVPEGRTRPIQHLEGGIVKEALVNNGDRVRAGQPLLRLEDVRAGAAFEIARKELDAALALEARLIAERDGAPAIRFPDDLLARREQPEVRTLIDTQNSLFMARRASLQGQIDVHRERIRQQESQIGGLEAEERARQTQLSLLEDELQGLRKLAERGGIPMTRVRGYEREIARLTGEQGRYLASAASTRESIAEARLQIQQLRNAYREDAIKTLSETQRQVGSLQERLVDAQDVLERREIRAPVDGIVMQFTERTPGAVIRPGAPVLSVVPLDEPFVIEAMLDPRDIENVKVGMKTTVRFVTLNRRAVPAVPGHVIYVAADQTVNSTSPESKPFYLTKVRLDAKAIDMIKPAVLLPGMPVQVFVDTGSRTVMDYLLSPIYRAIPHAMREQ